MNKKGKADESGKKRTRKVQKFQKAIVGMSLDDIKKKKAQKPELRQAAKEAAAKEAKARAGASKGKTATKPAAAGKGKAQKKDAKSGAGGGASLKPAPKKGKEAKQELAKTLQNSVAEYKNAFAVSFANMRASPFKSLMHKMKADSKFFLGKNKVVQVALGKTPEAECGDNTHLLANYMRGQVCLLLTNKTKEEAEAAIAEEKVEDFATAGMPATYTVFLGKGTEALDGYAHSLEPYLRTLGLPTKLNFQKIELVSDVYVCREGQTLNVEQAKILKALGHKMAHFKLTILCQRSAKGKFREFDAGKLFLEQNKE